MAYRTKYFILIPLLFMACSITDLPTRLSSLETASQVVDKVSPPVIEPTNISIPDVVTDTPQIPTETPYVDPVCVPPASLEPLPTAKYEEYPEIFLNFINAGGTADALKSNLEILGITNDSPTVSEADLTGNQKIDMVVSFVEPNPQSFPPFGALLIYICVGDHYILTHIEASYEFLSAPRILYVQDLNADGIIDVLYSSAICGASTCFEATNILSWDGSFFTRRFKEGTEDIPFPNMQITDYDRDGIYSIEMTSTGFGSVGAGPQREHTTIWDYNPASGDWEISNQFDGTSLYRIHLVHDADAALKNQEYEIATLLYNEVINNLELLDWMNREQEIRNLSAYAQYKLLVIYVLQGNISQATNHFNQIDIIYLPGSPQRSYIDMAAAFFVAFQQSGDIVLACQATHQYAAQHATKILTPLGSATYGYANPDYSPIDICP